MRQQPDSGDRQYRGRRRPPHPLQLRHLRSPLQSLSALTRISPDQYRLAVLPNGVTVRLPDGGFQSIVLQTREDGVSIDQVILSSEKYMTTRPGAAKNDHTILQFTYWQNEG